MAVHAHSHIAVKGISACVPADICHIANYPYFSEQEKNDFTRHVGVQSKRYSKNKLTTADLCEKAAEKLISELNWPKEEIGLLILVTQTADYLLPSTSILLQDKLKLSTNTLAFDVNLGCSGWVYGLSIAGSMMQALNISKALLLTGETSVLTDYKDKHHFPLMGDAGTATALEINDTAKIHFLLHSDGSGYDAIIAPESGARYLSENVHEKTGINYSARLNSQKVLEFCLRKVAPSIQQLMTSAKIEQKDIDYFIFHQANKIINESLRKRMQIPPEKLPYSIREFGNTSSASIPLTMVTQLRKELMAGQLLLLCSGFGVGLSIGNVLLKTNKIVCPDLIEV